MQMRLPLNSVQKYLYDCITQIGSTPVYDYVPAGSAYPYFTIGDAEVDDWSSKNTYGGVVHVHIVAWSDKRGYKEVNDMADSIAQKFVNSKNLLLDENFAIEGAEFESAVVRRIDVESGELRSAEIVLKMFIFQKK